MTKVHLDTKKVKVGLLEPNPWNPNRENERTYAAVRESIRASGFVAPVIVCIPDPGTEEWSSFGTWEKGHYLILDGEHRWKASQDEEMTEIAVNVIHGLTEATARRMTLQLMQHGEPDAAALLKCLDVLEQEMGEDARVGLPYESADIAKLKRIAAAAEGGGASEEFAYFSFQVAESAAKVIHQAIERVQKDQALTNQGTAIEYICADFLAGLPEEEES